MIPMRLGLARGEPLADGGPVAVPRLRQWPCHWLPSLCYEPRGARLGDGTPRPCCLAAGNQIFPFFWCVFDAWKKWRAGTQKILTLSSNVKTTSQSSARFPSWFLSENRLFFWLSKPELNFNNCDCPVVIFCPDGMAICCWHFLRADVLFAFLFTVELLGKKTPGPVLVEGGVSSVAHDRRDSLQSNVIAIRIKKNI